MSAGKLFLILIALGALAAGAWWFMPPSAKYELQKKWRGSDQAAENGVSRSSESSAGAPLKTTVYKWTDSTGQVHFTNSPPRNQPYETLTYRNDANVITSP